MPGRPASASFTLPHFIDQVFDAIARPAVALKVDGLAGEEAAAGSTFSVPSKIGPLRYVMEIAVTDYDKPYRIAYRLSGKYRFVRRRSSPPPVDAIYELGTAPEGTRVRFTQRNGVRDPIAWLLVIPLWPLALFGARREVKRLKQRIEAELGRS